MIAFIEAYKHRFGVERICRVLSLTEGGFLSSRGYRAATVRSLSARAVRDEVLGREIREVFELNYRVYGKRKMWHALRRRGWDVGRDQVARVMRKVGIRGKTRGRGPVTTRKNRSADSRVDLMNRQFKAAAPNRLWVADITYVRISAGFAYVAFVTDVFTRKIVGWAVSSSMTVEALPLQALDHAIFTARTTLRGLVHHADHGSQYCSIVYAQHLENAGIVSSTGSVGDSYDNALAEAVSGLYKAELIYPQGAWKSVSEVELATLGWVDWWNNARLHEGLGYKTPAEIETHYNETKKPVLAHRKT